MTEKTYLDRPGFIDHISERIKERMTPEAEARFLSVLKVDMDAQDQQAEVNQVIEKIANALYHVLLFDLAVEGKCLVHWSGQEQVLRFEPMTEEIADELDTRTQMLLAGLQAQQEKGDGDGDL